MDMGARVSSFGRSNNSHRSEPTAVSPDQLPGTSLGSSDSVIDVPLSYLKESILSDCVLIEVIDNISPKTDIQAFLYLFLEYTWNRLTAEVVVQGFDEQCGMVQADGEVLQFS